MDLIFIGGLFCCLGKFCTNTHGWHSLMIFFSFIMRKNTTGTAHPIQSIAAGILLALGPSVMAVLTNRYRWMHFFCTHDFTRMCFFPHNWGATISLKSQIKCHTEASEEQEGATTKNSEWKSSSLSPFCSLSKL